MAFGAAGLAAAALTSAPSRENNNSGSDGTDNQSYGSFFVNQFVFGCTAGCYHSFKVTFTTTDEQFKCFGSPRDQDYVECKGDATSASYFRLHRHHYRRKYSKAAVHGFQLHWRGYYGPLVRQGADLRCNQLGCG
jgi:hypothetical protein